MGNNYHFKIIEEAIHFISLNYREQPGLDEIADSVHLSKFHFQRLFHKWAGISPKDFLQFITIEHAKKCLIEGWSTLETAYEAGLSGNGRLHDLFLKIEACTPGEFQKRGKGIHVKYDIIDSPFGLALIAETDVGICKLSFLEEKTDPIKLLKKDFPEAEYFNGLGVHGIAVKKYFSNWEIPQNMIVLDLKGTPFQIKVWKALLSIPSSQLLAYNNIASLINNPNAVRAVGTAIGNNPIAYLIPCHRVIKQTGHIGEYRWGSERKIAIIAYENIKLSNNRIAGEYK